MNKNFKKFAILLVVIISILSVSSNSFAWFPNANHKALVNNLSLSYFENNSSYQQLTANAAAYTDEESYMEAGNTQYVANSYIISPYHAKANLNCTTLQPTSTTENSSHGYSLTDVTNTANFLYNLALAGLKGYSVNLNVNSYPYYIHKRIVQDLQNLINNRFSGTTVDKEKGYIILGVYLHLIQDIYAHRASVTTSRIQSIGSANFSSSTKYSEAITEATNRNGIPMIRLKDYGPASDSYEDNSSYWPERYSATTSATLQQASRWSSKLDFSFSSNGITLK